MNILRPQQSLVAVGTYLIVLGIAGCAKSPLDTPATVVTKPTEQPQPEPEDKSLEPDAYIRLGLPAHDREWSADDMKRAFEVLKTIAEKDPQQLPRYKSSRSGVCFSRITDEQNHCFFRNRSLPISVRLPQAANFAQSSNGILKLYLVTFLKKATGGSELMELMGAQLRMMVVLFELTKEFLPTIKKDDPTYQIRMQGLAQMKQGFAIGVAGSLIVLTEKQYRLEDRHRLLGYVEQTLPAIVPQLSPAARAETLARLEKLSNDPSLREWRPELRQLLTRLHGAAKQK